MSRKLNIYEKMEEDLDGVIMQAAEGKVALIATFSTSTCTLGCP